MPALSLATVHNPRPGWYRGDFHAHTNFSDGVLTPPELAQVAREAGLDFFAITDHNSVGAYPHFGDTNGLLIIPGMEVTFMAGDFNVFGIEDRLDWMEQICAGRLRIPRGEEPWSTTELMRRMLDQGLIVSINHPLLRPWAWEFAETDLRQLHCLEIWNDPSWPNNARDNPRAVQLWTDWLNAGYRITAIGGSDFHRPAPPPGENKPAERLGTPSTYVYAAELSGRAILEALRQHRAYVSMGPRVELEATVGDQTYGIGESAGEATGEIRLRARVEACAEPAHARLIRNGAVIAETGVAGGTAELDCAQCLEPGKPEWFRLDVWEPNGLMLAVTNPIYAGPELQPTQFTYGEFVSDLPAPRAA